MRIKGMEMNASKQSYSVIFQFGYNMKSKCFCEIIFFCYKRVKEKS